MTALNVLLVPPADGPATDVTVIELDAKRVTFDGPVAGGGLDSYAWSLEFTDLGGTLAEVDYSTNRLTVAGTPAAVTYALSTATR